MEQNPIITKDLLDRFYNDQCNDAERQAILDWLADPANKLQALQFMEHRWSEMHDISPADIDVEKLLSQTEVKISGKETTSQIDSGKVHEKPHKTITWPLWRVAAVWVGVILVSSGLLFFLYPRNDHKGLLTANERKSEALSNILKIETSSGEIIEKVLPDGTKVTLNARSSLIFPVDFSGHSDRMVTLSGEAFFDVAEDKAHPFIVKTGQINIVVLGTAFNLKSYEGDPTIETTLIRGKVVIENNAGKTPDKVVLRPNQKAVFSYKTESITLFDLGAKPTNLDYNVLEFEDDPIYDVIKGMERWYGVTIHVEDESNLSCRLTARIDKESLAETLEILESLTGIQYSVVGQEVFIKGKICEH